VKTYLFGLFPSTERVPKIQKVSIIDIDTRETGGFESHLLRSFECQCKNVQNARKGRLGGGWRRLKAIAKNWKNLQKCQWMSMMCQYEFTGSDSTV
jgi:hypothetical protein